MAVPSESEKMASSIHIVVLLCSIYKSNKLYAPAGMCSPVNENPIIMFVSELKSTEKLYSSEIPPATLIKSTPVNSNWNPAKAILDSTINSILLLL